MDRFFKAGSVVFMLILIAVACVAIFSTPLPQSTEKIVVRSELKAPECYTQEILETKHGEEITQSIVRRTFVECPKEVITQ